MTVVLLCLQCEKPVCISCQERKPVFYLGRRGQFQFNPIYQAWFGVKHTLDTCRLSRALLLVGRDEEEMGMEWLEPVGLDPFAEV